MIDPPLPGREEKLSKLHPKRLRLLTEDLRLKTNETPYWKLMYERIPTKVFYERTDYYQVLEQQPDPAHAFLQELIRYNVKVEYIIKKLEEIGYEKALLLLKPKEKVLITVEPVAPVRLQDGDTLTLTCSATGLPSPEYHWMHIYDDGGVTKEVHLIEQLNSTLIIPDIRSRDHSGTYYCKVFNELGYTLTKRIPITIIPRALVPPAVNKQTPTFIFDSSHINIKIPASQHVQEIPLNGEATGPGPITYQWYKDGQIITGATDPIYKVVVKTMSDGGDFMCKASNPYGETLMKKPHTIKAKFTPGYRCYAEDKVALLIGNDTYRTEGPLPGAKYDVLRLTHLLEKLGFRVYSFMDLGKEEILQAVELFCSVIAKGAYVTFYFVGHGFEQNGQCYLVPVDTRSGYTIADCLSATEIQCMIQNRDPALFFFILDTCREGNDLVKREPVTEIKHPEARGNIIILYATSPGLQAFEDNMKCQGILMKNLQHVIDKEDYIEIVVKEVFQRIMNDAVLKRQKTIEPKQVAQMTADLAEPLMLTDKIRPADKAGRANRIKEWERLHNIDVKIMEKRAKDLWKKGKGGEKPDFVLSYQNPASFQIPVDKNAHLTLKIEVSKLFTNVMLIMLKAYNIVGLEDIDISIVRESCPQTVALVTDELRIRQTTECKDTDCKQVCENLVDLQRLQEDLVLTLKVRGKTSKTRKSFIYQMELDLGRPLASSLDIWKRSPQQTGSTGRPEPIEHTVETSSGILTHQMESMSISGSFYNMARPGSYAC